MDRNNNKVVTWPVAIGIVMMTPCCQHVNVLILQTETCFDVIQVLDVVRKSSDVSTRLLPSWQFYVLMRLLLLVVFFCLFVLLLQLMCLWDDIDTHNYCYTALQLLYVKLCRGCFTLSKTFYFVIFYIYSRGFWRFLLHSWLQFFHSDLCVLCVLQSDLLGKMAVGCTGMPAEKRATVSQQLPGCFERKRVFVFAHVWLWRCVHW